MNDIEDTHRYFRACAELAKRFGLGAFLCDLVAALIAVHGLLSIAHGGVTLWRPLVAFTFLVAATTLRGAAEYYDRFAQKCRRISSTAYALDRLIPPQIAAELRSDAPPGATCIGIALPAQSLDAYYEPSSEPGESRLREMTAHSSFYTWRLLRSSVWAYGLVGAIIVFATIVFVYQLAAVGAAETMNRDVVLDTLFSVVLGFLAVQTVARALSCRIAANAAKTVADRLINRPLPAGPALFELVTEYDMERACSPAPPTLLYKLCRQRLAKDWQHRKRALG